MAYQSQSNGLVAFKAQSGKGTLATGGSGYVLRTTGGGLQYAKGVYGSKEVRRDLMRSRGRHGLKTVTGTYPVELSLAMLDAFLEALFRTTAETALVKTEADNSLTSVAVDSSGTLTAGGGSWITAGFRVFDIVRLTNNSAAGNNGRNLLITGLTATVMTVVCLDGGTLTTAGADTSFTLTRPGKKITNPAAPVAPIYFTIEEWDGDLDLARVFGDCRVHQVKFTMQPSGIIMADITFTGTGLFDKNSGGSSPSLTSPSEFTGIPMSAIDAVVRFGSTVRAELTGFDLTIDIGAVAPEVAAATISPDVFTGSMGVSLSMSMLMSDYTDLTAFVAETAMTLSATFAENESEPKDFFSIAVPNFTLGGWEPSNFSMEAGPRTITIPVPVDLVGKDVTGGAYDATMVKILCSNS